MLDNDRLARYAATFKKDASKEFDKAVMALISLAWEKGDLSDNFLWEANPQLDAEANAILRDLSDTLAEKAKERARVAVQEMLDFDEFDTAWDQTDGDDYDTILFRLDMQGSHLKDLLAIWIALAVVNNIGKSELRVLVLRYLNNPFTSPLWKRIPIDSLRWGRGYSRNVLEQLTLIGQNAIIGAVRFAEWMDASERGAKYYIRRRGSSYACDECQELANKPIPIEVPFVIPHGRCMCYAEYFFDEIV